MTFRLERRMCRRTAGLAVALTLCVLGSPVAALTKSSSKNTAKPFLPPVASINNKLEHSFQADEAEPFEAVTLSAISAPTLKAGTRVEKLDTPLTLRAEDEFMALVKLRQTQDEADLDRLWNATVERNPVIRFSMEKLMTPVDLQSKHSAMFSKVVSTLIQGAALSSQMFLPMGSYENMGAMALAQATDNLITGRNKPQVTPLTPTEQIQLAGLIDELKGKLIQSYGNYKNTLQLLSEARQVSLRNNNLYSKALGTQNQLAIMAAASAYYQALQNETELRQKARLYQVQLERLAGADAVQALELAVVVPDSLRKNLPVQTATLEVTPSARPADSLFQPTEVVPASTAPQPIKIPAAQPEAKPTTTAAIIQPKAPVKPAEPFALPAVAEPIGPSLHEMTPEPDFIGPTLELAPDILPFSSYNAPIGPEALL